MKNKIYLLLTCILLWSMPVHSFGQVEDLKSRLTGKETFKEISETFEQYINTLTDSDQKQRLKKHFARWAYYQSMHLGPNGEFVNISQKTMEAVSALTDAPLTTANGSWIFVGPNSSTIGNPTACGNGIGRVDRIAFHPTNALVIYIGTPAGGLWRTTTGGVFWACLSNFIPSLGISGIVVDHSDPNTIYVLTGDGDSDMGGFVSDAGYLRPSVGVLVSHDGGTTWQQTGVMSSSLPFTGYKLIQHPTIAGILIAATSVGIYRTKNFGQTWVHETIEKCCDVEFKPGSPSTVYASGLGSFISSADTGNNWANSTFDHPLCSNGRVEIGVSPDSPNRVFLLAGPKGSGNSFCGFYESTNSGIAFTRKTFVPNVFGDELGVGDQSDYDIGLAVKPNNYQTIITGGLVTYFSLSGGLVFLPLTTYWESGGNYIHSDVHCVAYNPLNNILYAATDGGFYASTDDGTTWADFSAGITTTQLYHLDDFDANADVLLTGNQDNGVKYKNTSTSAFSHISSGDGGDVVIDYTNQHKGYTAVNNFVLRFTNFTTTGSTPIRTGNFFMQVEMNTSMNELVYIGDHMVYAYNATAGTTTQLGNDAHGQWALKTCPSNSMQIYAAGGSEAFSSTGRMYSTADGGGIWNTISTNPGFPLNFPRISDIGVNPLNSLEVYACFSGYSAGMKVLHSSDAGATWVNISYDLPNIPVWSIEVDASQNVYIGCDIGVYYRAYGATHWEPFYNGLPNVPVSDLAINEGEDQLLAATFGRGVWKSSLRASCPANLNIFSNVAGPYFGSASNSISMISQVIGGTGTTVVLRSNGYVDLLPGFRADADPGNKFLAYLGPCGSGLPPVFVPVNQGGIQAPETYEMKMNRSAGTLAVTGGTGPKMVVVRLFEDGPVRVMLTDSSRFFIRDIVSFDGQKGESTYNLGDIDLKPGRYYLYLAVNDEVTHLQEMEIE